MKKGYEAVLVEGAEALADDLAGVDDGDKAVGVVLPQKVAQLQSLPLRSPFSCPAASGCTPPACP